MMENRDRVIPIECKFGKASAYAYYIDAPKPALIDTGVVNSVKEAIEPELLKHGKRIEEIEYILLTHGHVDHLGGAYAVWEKTGKQAKVAIPSEEADLLKNRELHLRDYDNLQGKYLPLDVQEKHKAILMQDIGESLQPEVELRGGEVFDLGEGISLKTVQTPGHSRGQVTFILEDEQWAFAADAVQMYGGANAKFPNIEEPGLYRESLKYLLHELRPKRLFLGHHFLDKEGNVRHAQLDGEEVQDVLKLSLELEERLRETAERFYKQGQTENDDVFGSFKSLAKELNYTGDPRIMPSGFLVTMHGYFEEMKRANRHKVKGGKAYDSEKI